MHNAVQLSLLPLLGPIPVPRPRLEGNWCIGDRLITVGTGCYWASVWLHFLDQGKCCLVIRSTFDHLARRLYGTWAIKADELLVSLGEATICSPFRLLEGGVLHWAGEVLVCIGSGQQPSVRLDEPRLRRLRPCITADDASCVAGIVEAA